MAVRVRPAERDDIEGIRTVARASFHDTYDTVLGPGRVRELVSSWYSRDTLAGYVRGSNPFYIAEWHLDPKTSDQDPSEEIVGFALATVAGGTADLDRIYVHPDHQSEGIGTRLLDEIIDELQTREVGLLTAVVMADNTAARRFYESRGFVTERRRRTRLPGSDFEVVEFDLQLDDETVSDGD